MVKTQQLRLARLQANVVRPFGLLRFEKGNLLFEKFGRSDFF
jgi:hypothetical protein